MFLNALGGGADIYAAGREGRTWHVDPLSSSASRVIDALPCALDASDTLHAAYVSDAGEVVYVRVD